MATVQLKFSNINGGGAHKAGIDLGATATITEANKVGDMIGVVRSNESKIQAEITAISKDRTAVKAKAEIKAKKKLVEEKAKK